MTALARLFARAFPSRSIVEDQPTAVFVLCGLGLLACLIFVAVKAS
jgi:hypothetical protein